MDALINSLLPLITRERAAGRALALALVVHTHGSTYRKPGALMAIAADGEYAGLLSGGCLETDLREHAHQVIESGRAHSVTYETGGSDDLLWGLGVGCEGAMQILLFRLDAATQWQPADYLAQALSNHTRTAFAVTVESALAGLPAGSVWLPGAAGGPPHLLGGTEPPEELRTSVRSLLKEAVDSAAPGWRAAAGTRIFAAPLELPPRLLLLGGGPDALPIVALGAQLGWKVTVFDHRPAYAQATHFPGAERVALARPEELARTLDLDAFEAAVVMSHHLPSDLTYLQVLAACPIGYVGLLGPPIRRERLLADLGGGAQFGERLHAPVGLDLGGRAPEAIALAIVAEIHAVLHGRTGAAYAATRGTVPAAAPQAHR